MEILQSIKSKLAEIAKKKEELTAELRQDFAPMLKPLFDKSNGKIQSISWTQYTPYFNDGEECIFSVNLDYSFKINGEDSEDAEDYVNFWDKEIGWPSKPNPNYDKFQSDIISEFKEILSSIDDEFYKDLFGDHVEVTVNSSGEIETEGYEHD